MFADGTPRELFHFFFRSIRSLENAREDIFDHKRKLNKSIYVRARGKNCLSLSLFPFPQSDKKKSLRKNTMHAK